LLQQDHTVRLVYKDLPILGPESVLAAHALLAAQKQNGYEKLRTALMQAPPGYTKEQILAIARTLGLDDARLGHDMDDAAITARIDANLRLARDLGLDGTPALVIGDTLVRASRAGGWNCRRLGLPAVGVAGGWGCRRLGLYASATGF
jgi:protein-disulfide isomerase